MQYKLLVNFIILITPLFSYGLTSYQIHVKKSAEGFSIDVCLIMIISSILKIIYYMLEPFEISLLRQSVIMIFIQSILLLTALKYYETPKLYENDKILNQSSNYGEIILNNLMIFDNFYIRPYNFWQWFDDHIKFWEFLATFTVFMTFILTIFRNSMLFVKVVSVMALFTESLLPLPQILLIYRLKSVKNFKWILIVSWLCGDILKLAYLLFGTTEVSGVFFAAAIFQMMLDFVIVGQFFYYNEDSLVLPVSALNI